MSPFHVPPNSNYEYDTPSQTDEISDFLKRFANKIQSMFLTNDKTNQIFDLSIGLVEEFTRHCQDLLKNNRYDVSQVLDLALSSVRNKISENRSAYKRHKNLVKNDLFVEPKQMALGTHWEMVRSAYTNTTIPRLLQSKFHYVSILQKLRTLFEQKEFAEMYFEHNLGEKRHRCEDGIYENFCCGSVFKNIELFRHQPEAIQIQIATDDFEICNPLGSKAGVHKMCPIYFTIKNVPSQYLSKLSNIHLVSLCRSDDLKTKETDFNDLWEHIVREISYLEVNGIEVGSGRNLKGSVVYLGHDNLGANQVLGLVESFNSYFCRFCIASKKQTETMTKEDRTMLRTIENYESHLKIVADSEKVDFAQTKGIKRCCALNKLNCFHMLRNKSVDIMHDLCEGCIALLLKHIFQYFISKKVFTEDWLLKKIQFFDFGRHSKNTPSGINLKKDNLNQNASQMMCLFRNIGFILYEFRNDKIVKDAWICIETLQKIVQICFSFVVRESDIESLEKLITKHLESVMDILELFLTPKYHIMVHYPSIYREMGPIAHMNMMRFESKHKSLKNIAQRGKNFINITKTLSVQCQAELVFNGFTYCDQIDCGKIFRIDALKLTKHEQEIIGEILIENEMLCEIEWLKCNNFTYRKGCAILHDNSFFEVDRILVLHDKYFFLCSKYQFRQFCSFTNSLIVEKSFNSIQSLISFNQLIFKKPYDINIFEKKCFIFAETLDVCQVIQ